jgi:fatty acid desaturase
MKRPPLPRSWYRPTLLGFLSYLLFSIAWLPVFGLLSISILNSDLPTWARVALLVPSVVLTGHGFHMIGWFAHDGIHLSLIKNKYWSTFVGCLFGGVALFPTFGYGVTHWNHHRFTNQDSDPDTKIYPRFKTFWGRFFFGRATANRGYFRNSLFLALDRPLDKGYRMPFTDGWGRFFAIVTLLSVGSFLAFYTWVAVVHPTYFLIGLFLPYLTAIPTSGLRIYLEHNGTGAGVFRDTRSYVSPFWTAVMFGNNFHLEHHLYPTVPAYHLPKVHRLLKKDGIYDRYGAHIVGGVLAPLQFLSARYQYPEALFENLEADPFVPDAIEAHGQG